MKDEVKNSYFSQGTKKKKKNRKRQNHTTGHSLLELIVVHYLMFYDQQFRLGVDKHHLPKSSRLCRLKQRLPARFLRQLCFESTFGQR